MRLPPRNSRRPALRLESLESRTVPALLALDALDVQVANTANAEGGPDVAMRPDGQGFVVVWEAPDGGGGSPDRGVFFRQYDANWQPLGAAVAANTVTANTQNHPSLGIDAAGNFVVAWQSNGQDGSGFGVYARRYNASGTPIDAVEFLVNTTTANSQFDPDVAVDAASGAFSIAWWGGSFLAEDVFIKGYAGIGVGGSGSPTLRHGEVTVNNTAASSDDQGNPAVAIDAAGNTVVAWDSFGQDAANTLGIYYRRVNANGTLNGGEVPVNTVTAGNQIRPDVAMDGAGNFVIVWQSPNVDGSGSAVVMQRYNASAVAQGGNVTVNTTTTNDQFTAHVTRAAGGDYVVTWTGDEADGDATGTDIYYKKFNSAGAVLIGETVVNTGATASNDITQDNGVAAINSAGDFVVAIESGGGTAGGFDIVLRRYAEAPVVQFANSGSSPSEAIGTSSYTVQRTAPAYVNANVSTAVSVVNTGGTAAPGVDFATAFPQTVTIAAGSTSQTANVAIVNDATFEGNETIIKGFGASANYTIGGTSSRTITIVDNDPAPTVTVSSPSVTEGNASTVNLTFTISLSAVSGIAVSGTYATADGTATAGSDYVAIASTAFSIPAGSTSTTVNVTVNGDTLFEGNETLLLNLSGITNASNATASGTGTINNDDAAPTVSIGNATLTEGDSGSTNMTFTVTLTGATALTTTVNYATANGSAIAGTDYTAASGTLTFAPGDTSETFTVPVIGNTIFQANRQFTATLSGPTNAAIGTGTGTGTITDDDAAASIAISSGNNQTAVTNANFASPLVALVRNANNNPVQGVSVVFTAPAAGASSVFSTSTNTITVTTNASGLASTGTFAANGTAGGPYNVSAAATGGTNPTVNFSLTNLPPTNFSIDDVTATEGNGGTTTYTFTVSASPAPTVTSTVNWATADNTATAADNDYAAASGTLSFAPGVTTQTISVTVNGDVKFEGNETFFVNLSGATNAGISDGQGVGTITNDDSAPTVSINDVTLAEGNAGSTAFTFTVTLSAASGLPVTFDYATAAGTATAGSDYTAVSATPVTIAAGATTQTVTVQVSGDTTFEAAQTFLVNLSNVVGATAADGQGLGTINNDDAAPTISINDVTASEAAGTIAFTVTLTGPTEFAHVVDYNTAPGSATAGADYGGASAGLFFSASTAATQTQTVNITLTNDNVYEAVEQFFVNLSNPTLGATISDTQGVGTITNDDAAPTIAVNDITVSENGTATFTVTLTGATALPIAVNYATADGTAVVTGSATPGTPDYTSTTGTLTFPASAAATQTLTVAVPLVNDTTNEPTEQFVLNLSGASNGATISDTQGVATVTDDDAAPTLSVNDVTAAEGSAGANPFTFTVTLSAASAQTVTVSYATADGTAGAPSDYAVTTGTLTFAPGVTTQTVVVVVSGDAVFEPTETFVVNLSAPTNATVGDGQGLGTITNDDDAPTLSINDVTVSESAGTLTFTVTRTGETELAATVDYATAGGSAVSTAGGPGTPDYTATSGTLTFPASLVTTATQTFTVTLTNDNVYEAVEQFLANLSAATNATITDGQGVATITNDDAAPTLSVGDISVSESGTATFTVTLTGATALPIAVDYATADGTAVAAGSATPGTPDYTTTTGTLTFAPSASGTQTLTFTVPLTDDATNEADETFVVNLSNASNGATISDAQAVGTITDDDPPPTLSIDDVTVAEGNAGTTAFTFTVSLSAASAQTVTVDFATADGSALAGSDYIPASGTLTFAPGVTTQTVTVLVTGDTVFEPDQTFTVNLSGPTNATVADGEGVGTVTNDDAAPTLAIDEVTVSEAAGTLTFTVTRTGATEVPITVDYATAGGSAVSTAGGPGTPDFAAAAGTLTFAPSLAATATQTFTVNLTDDNVFEAVEQFLANLSGPTGATIADGQGVATITNDDAAPTLSVGDITVSEDGTATFTVTLTGATALPVAVDYATADGSAVSAGSATPGTPDYTTTTGTVTFAPSASGTQTLTFTVPLTDDATNEADETFVVDLSNASNAATISDAQGVATITDDDPPPTVTVDDVTLAEGDGGTTAFTFTVTLSAASAQTITVNFATTDGTATVGGLDYVSIAGVLTFAPGVTTRTVTVLAVGDTVYEADETFTVDLSAPTNTTILDGQGVGTITNDDAAPTLAIGDVTVPEAAGTLTFTVTRTGATELPITVDYATADGSAVSTAGGPGTPDFAAAAGTLTFAPSLAATATQTFTVALTNDNVYEAVEQFLANLTTPNGATIDDGQGVATITNDDAAPTIAVGDIAVSENGTATFTVMLTGASQLPIAVDYGTINGTAVAAGSATPGTPDYTTTTGTLTFAPSASATQTLTVTVPLTNDTTNETTEAFGLDLANPTNGSTITTGTGTATVTDDDPPPTVAVDDVTLAEGNAGTTAFTFTVTLSAASAQTITVGFATTDGTALNGSDYAGASGTLTFAPGVTTQTVTVLVNGDTVFEPNQTFTVDLLSATNAVLFDVQGVGTVTNDDAPPTLSVSGVVAAEGAGTLTFTVTRTGATEVPITVNYATANGTALAGSDYTATSGSVTFAPSLAPIATQTFAVPIAGDTADEPTETFTATLSGAAGATIATATGTGTITDDDLPVAVADTATTLEDGSVTAPSVLGNDNAAPGSVVELVGPTTPNGTLALNPDGTFSYAPAANFNGTNTFQYRVRNPAGEVSNAATVTITVTAVNDVPSVTLGSNQTVGRSPGAVTVPGWATNLSAGPPDESGQQLAFLVGATGTTGTLTFDVAPAIDPDTGTLTFTPTPTTFGTATFTVLVADDGGTANGGKSSQEAGTFTITVTRKSTGDDTPVDQTDFAQFAASAGPGGPGTADVYNPNGSKASSSVPFGAGVGVRAVLADFTGDGTADLIAGSGVGVPGRLVVTDPTTGKTILSDFPFGAGFTGGLFVAAGDVNADGRADVIVTPDASGGGRVVIYDGATGQVVASFLGIDDEKFRGGARVAVGDVNGDGVTDVIVSAGLLGGPRVAVFDGTSLKLGSTPRKLINDFFAFDESLRDGVYVAAGDLNNDGFADLIFGGGPGGGARVLARDGKSLFGPGATGQFVTLTNFLASDPALRAGVQVAVKDADGDGRADLVTAVQTPTGPDVRLYLGKDLGVNGGPFVTDLDPYPGLLTGIYVG